MQSGKQLTPYHHLEVPSSYNNPNVNISWQTPKMAAPSNPTNCVFFSIQNLGAPSIMRPSIGGGKADFAGSFEGGRPSPPSGSKLHHEEPTESLCRNDGSTGSHHPISVPSSPLVPPPLGAGRLEAMRAPSTQVTRLAKDWRAHGV